MRKKIFAIVMSTMMMVGFMPSMAFAAVSDNPTTHAYVFGEATEVALASITNLADNQAKYVEVTKQPTCTKAGKAVETCIYDNCDSDVEGYTTTITVAATGHDWEAKKYDSASDYAAALVELKVASKAEAKAFVKAHKDDAVCYYEFKVCKNCGRFNHSYAELKDGTSTAVVHNAGYATSCAGTAVCSVCGKTVKASTTNTPAHTWATCTDYKVATPADCTSNAWVATQYCTVCGALRDVHCADATDTDADATLAAKGHKFAEVEATEALVSGTHTLKDGYICLISTETNARGQQYADPHFIKCTVENTNNCTTDQNVVKCANCDEYLNVAVGTDGYQTINTTWKAFCTSNCVKKTAPATTTNYGYTAHKANHVWDSYDVAATCTRNAYTIKQCENCDAVEYVYKDADDKDVATTTNPKEAHWDSTLNHNYTATFVAPTCTANGYYEVSCSKCEGTHSDVTVRKADVAKYMNPKTGDVITKASYSDLTVAQASDYTVVMPYVAYEATGHTYGNLTKYWDATCQHPAYYAQKCSTCGKWLTSTFKSEGEALDHNFTTTTYDATCTSKAFTLKVCSMCGKAYVTTDAVKDHYVATVGDDRYETVEKVVEFVKNSTAKVVGEHTYVWTTETPATIFEEGTAAEVCSKCGFKDGNTDAIDKLVYAKPIVKTATKKATVKVTAQAGAVSYKVMYKRYGAKYAWKSVKATAGAKTIKKLAAKKYYYFKVVATDADGCSVTSATTMAKVK